MQYTGNFILFVKTVSFAILLFACAKETPIISEKVLTNLLIDIHLADGTLNIAKYELQDPEKSPYTYYNWIYEKYGINEVVFDSAIRYYTEDPKRFGKVYDSVIDSLNRLLTIQNLEVSTLKMNDSINYFPYVDTIFFDSVTPTHIFTIDSISPGQYNFTTTFQYDSTDNTGQNKIISMFIPVEGEDTLRTSTINIRTDYKSHKYSWSQYVDSTYNKLIIRYLEPKKLKKGDIRSGKAWDTYLYRPYISHKRQKQLQQILDSRKERERLRSEQR